jgi:hypothetical protein
MPYEFVESSLDFSANGITIGGWNEIYTVPADHIALLFSGHISNTDTTNKVTHPVGMAAGIGLTPTRTLLTEIPIPYGASLNPGKALFVAGESVFVKADVIFVHFNLNLMLKSV